MDDTEDVLTDFSILNMKISLPSASQRFPALPSASQAM